MSASLYKFWGGNMNDYNDEEIKQMSSVERDFEEGKWELHWKDGKILLLAPDKVLLATKNSVFIENRAEKKSFELIKKF